MNDDEKYIEAFVQDIPFESAEQEHRDALKKQLLHAFPRDRLQPTASTVSIWRAIMKGSIPKFAVAAAIVIAVLVGLNVINVMPTGSVAWGQVLDNVRKAKSFAYLMTTEIVAVPDEAGTLDIVAVRGGEGTLEIETEVVVDIDHGARITSHTDGRLYSNTILSIPQRTSVTILPDDKKYVRTTMSDAHLERMGRQHGDPRTLVETFMAGDPVKLGRRTIDGTTVEGIESHDPRIAAGLLSHLAGQTVENVTGRLWVSVADNLPVRLEIEVSTEEGDTAIEVVADTYRWDIEMAPGAFEPDIPEDYELGADIEVAADLDAVTKGLRFFAKCTNGKYPTEISAMTMGRELHDAIAAKRNSGQALSPQDKEGLLALQVAVRFYARLVMEDRDPAYYGDAVTAARDNAVLMRWRLDDGRYQVLFADLTTREVTADALTELEKPPLKP